MVFEWVNAVPLHNCHKCKVERDAVYLFFHVTSSFVLQYVQKRSTEVVVCILTVSSRQSTG